MQGLRILREGRRMSQQKLADETALTQQKIHAYETGINEPDIETLKLLAKYFETSVDYLVDNTDDRRKIENVQPHELNEAEAAFVSKFRQVPPNLRESLSLFMDSLMK